MMIGGRDPAHATPANFVANVTEAITSDVIALPRGAIHSGNSRDWEEIR
jgi:hypothetical protein